MAFQPFDPDADVRKFRNHLPHWRQTGVTYFVTTRLADSVPRSTLKQWTKERDTWLRANGCSDTSAVDRLPDKTRRDYHTRFTARFHEYLDSGWGECWLRRPEPAAIVAATLHHFDGDRYALYDFVVMPNHLHVLVNPNPPHELSDILHSWKRFSAREINKLLGREGAFWQAESFNHIVRSEAQFDRFRRHIAENPAKARLREGEFLHLKRRPDGEATK